MGFFDVVFLLQNRKDTRKDLMAFFHNVVKKSLAPLLFGLLS